MFDEFMTESIKIHKANGEVLENIKANIQPKGITIQNIKIPIVEGDVIENTNPAGILEKYLVTEVHYSNPSFAKEMAHISIKYRKESSLREVYGNTYNLNNSNLSINSSNTNQSNTNNFSFEIENFNDLSQDLKDKLIELKQEISKQDADKSRIQSILKHIGDKSLDVLIAIALGVVMKS